MKTKIKNGLTKVVCLMLICTFLSITSFQVSASSSIGSSVTNELATMTSQQSQVAAKYAGQFAAGLAAGAVVGAAVGFYARLGYEAVTYFIGQEAKLVSSFKDINYDPSNLDKFDNPKN